MQTKKFQYDTIINHPTHAILSLIENSQDLNLIKFCINYLVNQRFKNPNIFSSLERLIISEKNEEIRIKAINAIFKLFPNKTLKPLIWVLYKEDNFHILISITKILYHFNNPLVKIALVNKIKSVILLNEPFTRLIKPNYQELIEIYSSQQLSIVLLNVLLISILKSKFSKLIFKLKKGYVRYLDFSSIDKRIINWRSRFELENIIELRNLKYFLKLEELRLFRVKWVIKNEFNFNYFINHIKSMQLLPCEVARRSALNFLESLKKFSQNKTDIENIIFQLNKENLSTKRLLDIVINLSTLIYIKNRIPSANFKVEDGLVIVIRISNKPLYKIPQSIKNLEHLHSMIFKSCKIYNFPIWLGIFKNLEFLCLKDNNICEIPSYLKPLESLKFLDLSQNELKNISRDLEFKNLRTLNLSSNFLENIPCNLVKCSVLTYLNLSNNRIKKLNKVLPEINSLRYLILNRNKIRELPQSIIKLKDLILLSLQDNRLKFISKSILRLKRLRKIDLRWNKITKKPYSVNDIKILL